MRTSTTSYSYLLDGPPRTDGQPVHDYSETSSERFARRRREAAIAVSEERASRHAEQAQVGRHGPSSRDIKLNLVAALMHPSQTIRDKFVVYTRRQRGRQSVPIKAR